MEDIPFENTDFPEYTEPEYQPDGTSNINVKNKGKPISNFGKKSTQGRKVYDENDKYRNGLIARLSRLKNTAVSRGCRSLSSMTNFLSPSDAEAFQDIMRELNSIEHIMFEKTQKANETDKNWSKNLMTSTDYGLSLGVSSYQDIPEDDFMDGYAKDPNAGTEPGLMDDSTGYSSGYGGGADYSSGYGGGAGYSSDYGGGAGYSSGYGGGGAYNQGYPPTITPEQGLHDEGYQDWSQLNEGTYEDYKNWSNSYSLGGGQAYNQGYYPPTITPEQGLYDEGYQDWSQDNEGTYEDYKNWLRPNSYSLGGAKPHKKGKSSKTKKNHGKKKGKEKTKKSQGKHKLKNTYGKRKTKKNQRK